MLSDLTPLIDAVKAKGFRKGLHKGVKYYHILFVGTLQEYWDKGLSSALIRH